MTQYCSKDCVEMAEGSLSRTVCIHQLGFLEDYEAGCVNMNRLRTPISGRYKASLLCCLLDR
ncbi:MAG: hypothetical protein WED07_02065 [Candidatus Freyarchaeum deiterrae]